MHLLSILLTGALVAPAFAAPAEISINIFDGQPGGPPFAPPFGPKLECGPCVSATGTCQAPAFFKQFGGGCIKCCSLKDASSNNEGALTTVDTDVSYTDSPGLCWRMCSPIALKCPTGWKTNKLGDCNTCCKEDSQNVAEEPKKEVAPMSTENQICLLTCFDKKPECGETATPEQFGGCWTCCLKQKKGAATIENASHRKELKRACKSDVNSDSSAEYCLFLCMLEEPKCPTGLEAKKNGECWTCCKKATGQAAIEATAHRPFHQNLDLTIAINPKTSNDLIPLDDKQKVCLHVCFPTMPTCPKGWIAERPGGNPCWSCCHAS